MNKIVKKLSSAYLAKLLKHYLQVKESKSVGTLLSNLNVECVLYAS